MRTALTKTLRYIRRYHASEADLIEYVETLLQDEREQIVSAWIKGNEEGWEQTTDWPEHGERYYEEKYGNEKAKT